MSRSSRLCPQSIQPGDIVGISVHTGNALRGYAVGRMARARGAWVVYGGIHATLFPDEALERGEAHAVVKGDGDLAWAKVVTDCLAGKPERIYEGGRIEGSEFLSARWDLMDPRKYMWASVQTIRGCPKHCSFCSVWRTDGQKPRQRKIPKRRGRNHCAAPPRFSLHRPGRRQLLSRHVYRSAPRARAGQHRQGSTSSPPFATSACR